MHRPRTDLVESLEVRRLFAVGPFVSRGPGGGEEFFSPTFNPTNAAQLTVSSVGGYFRSADSGATWNIADHNQLVGGPYSRTAYTSNPNVQFSLTYDETNNSTLTRSIDGGATWSTPPGWSAVSNAAYGVYADPNSNRVVVGSDFDLFFSNDGGATFTDKISAPNGANSLYVAGAFFDGNNIYVGTNTGLIVSTDGGNTFTLSTTAGLPAGSGMLSFAGAKSGMTTRLFATPIARDTLYPSEVFDDSGFNVLGIYSLTVGSGTWTSKSAAIPANDHAYYIATASGDINDVYAAGVNVSIGGPVVIKTTDAGTHWTDIFTTTGNANIATEWAGDGNDEPWSLGILALGLGVAPNNINDIAITDSDGVYLTTNGGTAWRATFASAADLNAAGTASQQKPYHDNGLQDGDSTSIAWADANDLVAGFDDIRGVRSTDGGVSWSLPNPNVAQNTITQITTVANAASPSGVTFYGATSALRDLYTPLFLNDGRIDHYAGRLIFSNDKGASWSLLHDFSHPVTYTAIDPTNPNRMYAAVVNSTQGGIYVTNNLNAGASSTWTKLPSPARTQGHPLNVFVLNDGTVVATYTARATTTSFNPALTASSGVFVSTDHGLTWADRTLIGPPGVSGAPDMEYWTQNLSIDPTDSTQSTWYAGVRSSTGGDGSANYKGGLYKTTDRGVSWTRIYSDDSVESAIINPAPGDAHGDLYIATTSSGVVYSHNPTAATPTFVQTSYPYEQPERLFIDPYDANQLWVTSFGYGLSEASIAAPAPTVTSSVFNFETGPQSVSLQFSTDVSASLTKSDFTLTNVGTLQPIDPTSLAFTYNTTTNTATLSYTPGALPDGNYRLTLPAGSVTSAGGTPLASDYTFNFFALAGDANRDRVVNFNDLVILAQNYNQTGKTFSQGNFNYSSDGKVDFNDLVILAQHYGQTLTAPPAIVAPTGDGSADGHKHDTSAAKRLSELS